MSDPLYPYSSIEELRANRDFWKKTAERNSTAADYYRKELVKAHALIGRVIHQTSERWDSVNLTEHFPTDNLHRRRGPSNPSGE